MRFIDPKTDFAFKKIFGSDRSHAILISFLNNLIYDGNAIVRELEILNPYQPPPIAGIKSTYLDVRAKLSTGETVIIEMQVLNVAGFEKRVLYNAAKAYSVQLESGAQYTTLYPIIALTIADFNMFPDSPSVMSRFILKERDRLTDYPSCDIELIFAELPKFTLSLEQISSVSDQWLYFIKNAPSLELIPSVMETSPELQQAFQIARESNLNRAELEEMEGQQRLIQDQRGSIIKALEQGIEQGIEQGRNDEKMNIAQKLLALMDDATIAASTGLPIEVIQALRSA